MSYFNFNAAGLKNGKSKCTLIFDASVAYVVNNNILVQDESFQNPIMDWCINGS